MPLFVLFGFLLHTPEHTWWNGLWPPEHFLPGPSQVPGTDNQDGPTPRDEWPWYFQEVLLAVWLWKLNMGNTSLCGLLPEQPYMRLKESVMHETKHVLQPHRPKWPTSLWHPLRATDSLCAVGRTSCRRVPSVSLGLAHLYKTPFCSTRLFCSLLYWLNSGESVFFDQSCSSIPSLSLFIIIPKTGSASCAWHQSSRVIWATCWLSWIAPMICKS